LNDSKVIPVHDPVKWPENGNDRALKLNQSINQSINLLSDIKAAQYDTTSLKTNKKAKMLRGHQGR